MGTADAVFQNIDIVDGYAPEYIVVLAGDHVYKMDYELMLVQHVNDDADVTVGCIEVSVDEARSLGVMQVDAADRIVGFVEKPAHPPELPDRPGRVLASMGIYVFRREFLHDQLRRDAADPRFVARFRPRHHSVAREERARPSRTASSARACARRDEPRRTGATSARSTRTSRPTST